MRVGDIIRVKPETFGEEGSTKMRPAAALAGRVVYIHPSGRWCTLEFDCGRNRIRESFMLTVINAAKEGKK